MSEITLRAGQVWVPTKESPHGMNDRQIIRVNMVRTHWKRSGFQCTRQCWHETFRAWITRTGAVLREVSDE